MTSGINASSGMLRIICRLVSRAISILRKEPVNRPRTKPSLPPMAKPASALLALTRMWVHNLQAIQAVLVAEGIVPIVDGAAWACVGPRPGRYSRRLRMKRMPAAHRRHDTVACRDGIVTPKDNIVVPRDDVEAPKDNNFPPRDDTVSPTSPT
jgi:hypothetical protein